MTVATLIALGVNVSMALMVLGVALAARPDDIASLVRDRSLLARSLIAMYVIVPLAAVAVALTFDLDRSFKAALVVLAVSPVPPVLPKKEFGAGGSESYVVGLLAIAAIVAIVYVPAILALFGRLFGMTVHVPFPTAAQVVSITVLAPLAVGLVGRRIAPAFAARAARPVSHVATALLVVSFLPVIVAELPAMARLAGTSTLLAIALFTLASLAIGHLLGGPRPDDRTVLALSSASRHPGLAMAVLAAIAPDDKAAAPAVLLYAIAAGIFMKPYTAWRKRAHAAA